MKSQQEKDFDKSFKRPSRKRCNNCGSPEGYSPEGKPVRMVRVSDGVFACNYCANQIINETISGSGNRYHAFEVTARDSTGAVSEGFDDHFEREGSRVGQIEGPDDQNRSTF
jgi:hypothetical protein